MNKSEQVTRKMLSIIRENNNNNKTNKILIKENNEQTNDSFPITKNTPQFGDVRESQEQALVKTIGESIELDDNALVYYGKNKDLVLTGKINSLSLTFQFRFNDPSGEGCYIWANALQLTDTNNRTLGKVRDAFVNWKNALIQDGDLMAKLHQAVTKE
jgi:hypothetical protein